MLEVLHKGSYLYLFAEGAANVFRHSEYQVVIEQLQDDVDNQELALSLPHRIVCIN